jgi:hypothetical protein
MSNEASEYNELLDIVSDIVNAGRMDQEGLARLRAHLGCKPAAPATQRQAEPVASAADEVTDAQRLAWLETQKTPYGFQDLHEGNRWVVEGAYGTLRQAIDAAMQKETQ